MELAVISDVWFIFDQDKNEGLIPGRRPSPPELNRSQYLISWKFRPENRAKFYELSLI